MEVFPGIEEAVVLPTLTEYIHSGLGVSDPHPYGRRSDSVSRPRRTVKVWIDRRTDDGGFFTKWHIHDIRADDGLEGRSLPAGGTHGLFAFAAHTMLYLQRRARNVQAVLAHEAKALSLADPEFVAFLLSETLGRCENETHVLVRSPAEVRDFRGGHDRGYVVDDAELARTSAFLIAPSITETSDAWLVRFTSMFGWMHEKNTLLANEYRVSFGSFAIASDTRPLSSRMFRAMPKLRY